MFGTRGCPGRGPRSAPPGRRRARSTSSPTTSTTGRSQEFRSTSPWAVGQAVAALGRHHSRPWLSQIDVPTAVVVTPQGPGPPAATTRSRWPGGSPARPSTTSTPGTPRACCRRSASCRRCSRRRPPSTPGVATSQRAREGQLAATSSSCARLIGVGVCWATTAAFSAASSTGKRCTRSSTSGIDSRQAMIPTCTWPLLDITVMFSAGAVEDRAERVEPVDPGAHEVERHRRAGHVGDHQVVHDRVLLGQPQAGVRPHGEAEGARRGELRPVLQRVGADRLVVLLGVLVVLGHVAQPLERVLGVGAELGEERGDLVGAAGALGLARAPRPARSRAASWPAARRGRGGRSAAPRRRRRGRRR